MIHEKGKSIVQLEPHDKRTESVIYPLFFPDGRLEWSSNLEANGKNITLCEYVKIMTSERKDEFNPILIGGKLFQQYLVDSWVKIEQGRLNLIRNN